MFPNLCPGAASIRPRDVGDAVRIAREFGFRGVDIDIEDPERYGVERTRSVLAESGMRLGGWVLPVDIGGGDERFSADLGELPRWASFLSDLGCNVFIAFMMSGSNEFNYEDNFERMRGRFSEIGLILRDHGCVFGIEFLGPKTIRSGLRYEFIHDLPGMVELIDAVDTGNMGVLLDSWHWYTSGGDLDQVRALRPERVVYVHINDAPRGVPLDMHVDNKRAMPMETGVIDLPGFLGALEDIGYEGPVTPEPFNDGLKQMPPREAARVTAASVRKAWEAAGLEW